MMPSVTKNFPITESSRKGLLSYLRKAAPWDGPITALNEAYDEFNITTM